MARKFKNNLKINIFKNNFKLFNVKQKTLRQLQKSPVITPKDNYNKINK